jgi:hypothetical protein
MCGSPREAEPVSRRGDAYQTPGDRFLTSPDSVFWRVQLSVSQFAEAGRHRVGDLIECDQLLRESTS